MRITRRELLAATAALTAAGCSAVPTSGPVEQVSAPPEPEVSGGVDIRPVPPTPGASPEVVLAGFLDAMASLEPDHRVARQFLTPQAAQVWDPAAQVTVFDGDNRTAVVSGQVVSLQAPLVGNIDRGGHYAAAQLGALLRQPFSMARVHGEWRIATPPTGLLVSQYTMQHRFSWVDVWFVGHGDVLVPERVWLAAAPATATHAVQALLQGPSAWLDPAVSSSLPVGTTLAGPSVGVSRGVATVPLDDRASQLPDDQRTLVLQQLAQTLRPFDQVQALRVTVGGQPWMGDGQDDSGVVSLSALEGDTGFPPGTDGAVLAAQAGRAVRLDAAGDRQPVEGVLGARGWTLGISHLCMRDDLTAVVDRSGTRLATLAPGAAGPTVRLHATGIQQPQLLPGGELWVVVAGDGATALHRGTAGGGLRPVPIPELKGVRLLAASVSPDLARVAVVVERDGRRELGMLRIHDSVVDGYRRLPLVVSTTQLDLVSGVGWGNPMELLVLAAPNAQGRPSCYLVTSDASRVTQVGPTGDVQIRDLVVMPQQQGTAARVLLTDGRVLRFDGAWRWPVLTTGIAALGTAS